MAKPITECIFLPDVMSYDQSLNIGFCFCFIFHYWIEDTYMHDIALQTPTSAKKGKTRRKRKKGNEQDY